LQSVDPDVIGVTESWANDMIYDSELELPGYRLFRHDRPSNNHGGGVLLYIKSGLDPIEFYPKSDYPEHCWCKIKGVNNEELIIGVCYRTSNDTIFGVTNHQKLRELLNEVSNKKLSSWETSTIPVLIGRQI